MKSLHKNQNKGFTLVETLVAIVVLLLVIIGPITIAQKGIQNSYYAQEEMTATFLAQEALHSVRKIRDEYKLQDLSGVSNREWDNWYTALDNRGCLSTDPQGGCAYIPENTTSIPFGACANNNYCVVQANATGYGTVGGTDTGFTRKMTLSNYSADAVQVAVTVTWNSAVLGAQNVTIQTWLYNYE